MKPIESLTPRDLASVNNETLSMQQKLIIKQKELLELQQQKLKLELWQTQVKLQLGTTANPTTAAPAVTNKAATPNLVQVHNYICLSTVIQNTNTKVCRT